MKKLTIQDKDTCESCGGAGEFIYDFQDASYYGHGQESEDCHDCGGSGIALFHSVKVHPVRSFLVPHPNLHGLHFDVMPLAV